MTELREDSTGIQNTEDRRQKEGVTSGTAYELELAERDRSGPSPNKQESGHRSQKEPALLLDSGSWILTSIVKVST